MLEGKPHQINPHLQSFADVIALYVFFVYLAAIWVSASLHEGLEECPRLTEVRER